MSVKRFAFSLAMIAASLATSVEAQYSDCSDCGHLDRPQATWFPGLQGEGDWTVRGGALFLRRNQPAQKTIVYTVDSGLLVSSAMTTEDIEVDFKTGWEASVECNLANFYSAEFRYFHVNDMGDTHDEPPATGYGIITTAGVFFGVIDAGLASNIVSTVTFNSTLRSVEANLKRDLGFVKVIGGVRYFQFDEDLGLNFSNPGAGDFNNFRYNTTNDMIGLQVGLEASAMPEYNPLQVDFFVKAGVYYNDFEIRSGATTNLVGGSNAMSGLDGHTTSAAVELGIHGSYEITSCLSILGGVQLLWLNNVVEPTDQIAINGDPDGAFSLTNYDASGTPLFTGLFAGFQFIH